MRVEIFDFVPRTYAELFRRRSGEKMANRFSGDTPQGGLSCPYGAIHLLCVGKTHLGLRPSPEGATKCPWGANVRIVRLWRTIRALQQAAAFSKKWLCHFLKALRPAAAHSLFALSEQLARLQAEKCFRPRTPNGSPLGGHAAVEND